MRSYAFLDACMLGYARQTLMVFGVNRRSHSRRTKLSERSDFFFHTSGLSLMIASLQSPKMTPEEYLEWEARQEIRHEYCDGEVFAMAGGTKAHDKLAFNLRRLLVDCVEDQDCDITGSDVKVVVDSKMSYRYPDLAVSCDERDKKEATFYRYPKLIVEVLSPGTEAVDRGEKFQEYIQISTLEEYVLISANQIQVECFRRGEGRMWRYLPYKAGETVTIASLNLELPIEQIYRNVRLEEGLTGVDAEA